MIIPLTNTPTVNDLPHPVVELPSKFVMYEPDEAGVCTHEDDPRHVISCGICNKHCVVSREEYNADITPVCSECEQKAAELADAYDVVQ